MAATYGAATNGIDGMNAPVSYPASPLGTSPGRRLRDLIARPGTLVMPGAHDALSARLIQAHGFEAAFGGGSAATSTLLAEADSGQLSMRDFADHYARLAGAVDIRMLIPASGASTTSVTPSARSKLRGPLACSSRIRCVPSAAATSPARP